MLLMELLGQPKGPQRQPILIQPAAAAQAVNMGGTLVAFMSQLLVQPSGYYIKLPGRQSFNDFGHRFFGRTFKRQVGRRKNQNMRFVLQPVPEIINGSSQAFFQGSLRLPIDFSPDSGN